MRHARTTISGLVLAIAASGCFFPVYEHHRDRLQEEHRNPHIVILRMEPPEDRDCWRHDHHWHCVRD